MCGRFTQDYSWEDVHDYYNLTGPALNLRPSYNVAPTQTVHTIGAADAGRGLREARWGLVPGWWKKSLEELPATFNARAETVAEKPMFRSAFRQRRCLVPAGGYYEWSGWGESKQPYFIHLADEAPLTLAGLWEVWRDPVSGEAVRSCTVLTTDANSVLRTIHTRMPVVLEPNQFDAWIDRGGADLLGPCRDDLLAYHAVSKDVGNVRNNAATLREPIAA